SIIENSIAAINLIKLSKLVKNIEKNEYLKIAENILKAFYSERNHLGISGAVYGLAVQECLDAKT
ncbi:MAG: hypothetical protein AABX34_01190, partial [Nanoarchaeota archaeon]